MKKIALFLLTAIAAMVLLSRLPSAAQARTIVFPTPTSAPIVSGN